MKALTLLLLLPSLTLAQDGKARASWAWVTSQQQSAKKQTSWVCDVCQGSGRGGLCTNCDGTGKVDYDPAKDGPGAKPEAKKAPATLIIEAPATARLTIQGEEQYMTGETRRVFQSPPLEVGKSYYYTVKARDAITGKEGVATVEVKAGNTSRVRFGSEDRLPAVQFNNFWPGYADPSFRSGR